MSFAVDGKRIVFDHALSDGDALKIKAVIRVQPYESEKDLMFCGDETVARHCEEAVRLRLAAFICEIMGNSAQTADEVASWFGKRNAKMMEYHGDGYGGALAVARANVLTAQNGTTSRIRIVY